MTSSFSRRFGAVRNAFHGPTGASTLEQHSPTADSCSTTRVFLASGNYGVPFSLVSTRETTDSISSGILQNYTLFNLVLVVKVSGALLSFLDVGFGHVTSVFIDVENYPYTVVVA